MSQGFWRGALEVNKGIRVRYGKCILARSEAARTCHTEASGEQLISAGR
jgi:hypothetical protein